MCKCKNVRIIKKIYCLLLVTFFISCGGKKEEKAATEEMKPEEVNDTSVVDPSTSSGADSVTKNDSSAFVSFTIDKKSSFEEKVNKFIEKYELMYSEVEVNKPIIPER